MCLPARDCPQLFLSLHVLEKRNDAPEFRHDSGLQTSGVIILDKSAQSFMDHVSDLHGSGYQGAYAV
jgi:hypothetical protein